MIHQRKNNRIAKKVGEKMQITSTAYKRAVVDTKRRIVAKAIVDITDPDMECKSVTGSPEANCSKSEQIHNKVLEGMAKQVTLEKNRWVLDGSWEIHQSDAAQEVGYISADLSGTDGGLTTPIIVQLNVESLTILQAMAVYWSDVIEDGMASDLTITVYSGQEIAFSKSVTSNRARTIFVDGFEAVNITAIRIAVEKWTLPNRRVRVTELIPGIYEEWTGESIYSLDVLQEYAPDTMTLPYSVATLAISNTRKRFNPYAPNTILKSLMERQAVQLGFGLEIETGKLEYLKAGTFFLSAGGWDSAEYGATFSFSLVSLIGLLTKLDFSPPETLPETVHGWIEAVLGQLGATFAKKYKIDTVLAAEPVTANAASLAGLTCGTVLRYMAQAVRAVCWTDADGDLVVRQPTKSLEGIAITADNMRGYPSSRPADKIQSIKFTLADGEEYSVEGTANKGDVSYVVQNPFITMPAQAEAVAAHIMRYHTGNLYTVEGRGDLSSDLGDIDQFATGFGGNHSARRIKQQIIFAGGVVARAPSGYTDELIEEVSTY